MCTVVIGLSTDFHWWIRKRFLSHIQGKVLFFYRLREVGMPADYVNKLARMFQDIKVSEDLNQQFKEQYRSTKGSIAGEWMCAVCCEMNFFYLCHLFHCHSLNNFVCSCTYHVPPLRSWFQFCHNKTYLSLLSELIAKLLCFIRTGNLLRISLVLT